MCSKQQLRRFLEEICVNPVFPVFKYVSPESFSILIKCCTDKDRDAAFYNEYSKQWINKFSKFTSTGWIVRNCFPNMKRLLYRKTYVCHHSGYNKKKNVLRCTSRNKNCRATIDFKIRIINRNTIKNDKSLKDGLNMNIYMDFTHSHDISTTESYNLLKSSSETDDIFCKYFSQGHSPSSAKHYHELLLMSKHGMTKDDYSNSNLNPSIRHIFYLYSREKIQAQNISDVATEKIKDIESTGAITYRSESTDLIIVITPFMKNVLVGHERDCIIIDTTSIKDSYATLFFVPSPLGALPIACALHADCTELTLNQAFFLTKELIETQIYKVFKPKIIMANDVVERLAILRTTFPDTMICVSRTSMCESLWKQICNDVRFDTKKKHDTMVLFHSLIYANDMQEAEKQHDVLERAIPTPILKEYLDRIWINYQQYILTNLNTTVDTSLFVFREFIMCKCSNFNRAVMIDVLLNVLDRYWSKVVHSLLNNKCPMETLTMYLPVNKTVKNDLLDIKVDENEYRLCGAHYFGKGCKKRARITFRSDTMCCDCNVGKKGRYCEHLNALLHSFVINIQLTETEHNFYDKLAGVCFDNLKEEPLILETEVESNEQVDSSAEDLNDESIDNDQSECYYLVKEEIEEHCDPLEERVSETTEPVNSENEITNRSASNMKSAYENAMRNLNDEFRRLNNFFKSNPNVSNLETMVRLTKELSKIRPVEAVSFSNMHVEMNDRNMECNNQ